MDFSKNFDFLRAYFGASTAGLEKILGLSNGYIAGIEKKGTDNPGKLLLALHEQGISTDWFLTGAGSPFLAGPGVEAAPSRAEAPPAAAAARVPLLRQRVSCGNGVDWDTEDNIEEYLEIETLIPRLRLGRVFAMRAQGTSMIGMGIRHGDYILFDASRDGVLLDGAYVFSLDGDLFCKRLEFDALSRKIYVFSVRSAEIEKAELLKTIDTTDPSFADYFTIFGKVCGWIHPSEERE